LACELDALEKTKESRLKIISKLEEKEIMLYDKVTKESAMIYKYMLDKNKMDNNYYFRKSLISITKLNILEKVKMLFSRSSKSKILIKLVDEMYVLIFQINYKSPLKSEMLFRKFKDRCEFSKTFKLNLEGPKKKDTRSTKSGKSGVFNDRATIKSTKASLNKSTEKSTSTKKREELLLNHKKKLFIVMKKDSYVYDFKSNEIRRLSLLPLNENHAEGNLIHIPHDNSIYCIGGRLSCIVEKLKLPEKKEKWFDLKESWTEVCSLEGNLGNFVSFIVNRKVLFIILGYNHTKKLHCNDVVKIDVSVANPTPVVIKLKDDQSPSLTMASCLKFMDTSVYILGGMHSQREKNLNVYVFDTTRNVFYKTDYMITPVESDTDVLGNYSSDKISQRSTNFLNENLFTAVKFDLKYEENSFFFCLFDSSNYLHMINIKNFKHFMLFQDDRDVQWDEDSEDESSEVKPKNASSSNIVKSNSNYSPKDPSFKKHKLPESPVISTFANNNSALNFNSKIEPEDQRNSSNENDPPINFKFPKVNLPISNSRNSKVLPAKGEEFDTIISKLSFGDEGGRNIFINK
jgi:hypothetical protein